MIASDLVQKRRCAKNRWKDHLSDCEFRREDSNARSNRLRVRAKAAIRLAGTTWVVVGYL
jgi:hypothetical protein